jgi:hypothetical protein
LEIEDWGLSQIPARSSRGSELSEELMKEVCKKSREGSLK